jgi:ATP-dependent helicase HrpB
MLPVDAILPDLLNTLEARNVAVLVAPPGAGKTTRVPPALLAASWAKTGKIVVLSPRRIAARAAAARMASERGEKVGATIGYRVRFDTIASAATRIEVVTEGVFTRMILDDPELQGVCAVLFDEFHERSLDADLGLALARDAQSALRPDLRIVVMSATLDASRIATLLENAPIVVSEGRLFPVELTYRPRLATARLEDEVAAAVRAALAAERGSALVFLPGVREIERVAERLRAEITDASVDVRPLYGALSPADQDAAIAPSPAGRRKVVLATSIAETSLTIEGVRIVVDSGLSRRPRFEPALGLSRLETVRSSQAAIAQRAGRAGRLAPGACWRLWSEGETRALPAFDRPEIMDADLSGLALDLASWGVTDPATLTWLDPPPAPAWREAIALLTRLGALDADARLAPHGQAIARLPLPPRLAHMVLDAAVDGDALLAARIAMLLTEQGLGGRFTDLRDRLHRFDEERGQRANAARHTAEWMAKSTGASNMSVDVTRAGAVLARAFPDRVAKQRGGGFVMVNGRAASLDRSEALSREPFLVVADVAGAAGQSRILLAAPITIAEIEAMFGAQIETHASIVTDDATGAVRARRVRRLGRVVLSEAPLERLSGGELQDALLEAVREGGLSRLDWSESAQQLRARVALMRERVADGWPDWSEEALMASVETWLAPALVGVSRLTDVNVAEALLASLDFQQRRILERDAPARFETAAGSSLLIDYTAEGGPALDVRLQEMFGVDAHPVVAGQPLTLRLLSPAHRPVQTTKDLPGFWRGSYAAVRSEMRGRYPKHPWPEDPLNAEPTRRAKPRGS